MPFHCIECDKPINQPLHGLCDDCKEDSNARETQMGKNEKIKRDEEAEQKKEK